MSIYLRDKTAAAALEFALVAPLFIVILMSTVAYGIYMSACHSIQQLAADAARSAVAGLSSAERADLATSFIKQSTINNAFIDPTKLAVSVKDDSSNSSQFTVSLSYDATNLPIWQLYSFTMPNPTIRRFSTIRVGGQ